MWLPDSSYRLNGAIVNVVKIEGTTVLDNAQSVCPGLCIRIVLEHAHVVPASLFLLESTLLIWITAQEELNVPFQGRL